jgi:ribosomal protein S18 acetylase RimI-like enzyme
VAAIVIRVRQGARDLAVELAPWLDRWVEHQPCTVDLHSGDVGWHLRLPDTHLDGCFRVWDDGDEVLAAGLTDNGVLRLAISPEARDSVGLAEVMAQSCDVDYVDAPAGTALHDLLTAAGWSQDPDPWALLYKELGPDDAAHVDPDTRTLDGPDDGPTYDARFEMVTWTHEDEPAAAATGWFAGAGRCALLEPVGTSSGHRRQGYGRRVSLAVTAALAAAGASDVRVHTPTSNVAAVGTYEACGLRVVDRTVALVAPTAG